MISPTSPPAAPEMTDDGVKVLQWPGVMLIVADDGSAMYSIKADNPNNQYGTGGVDFELPAPLAAAIRAALRQVRP